MHIYKAPLRDISFAMNEVLAYADHYQRYQGGDELTPDTVSAILEETAGFSEQVLAPLNSVGDREGCRWIDGKVITPTGFKEAFARYTDGGWTTLAQPTEYGGQGLPPSLQAAVIEILTSANHAWCMYLGLITGAIATIGAHGSQEQKDGFLPKLVAGKWGATMCLTEAHCGSDLSLLRTTANPQPDGSYSITGTKIFISGGEHDLTENIVHLCLARLPDAPEGNRGISLFIVPKYLVNDDGSLRVRNSVNCGSIEHKMGIHGNSTCVLNFDDATGFLLGPSNAGLRSMFTFINESRLAVAQQALGHIELSFQGALSYAKERLQMRSLTRPDLSKSADPIIVHPDVRRMLLTQKAFAEGGRLFTLYCAQLVDLTRDTDTAIAQGAEERLALLTPIAKGFISEAGVEAANCGIQILGGHGYINEWGMEQILRDVRITPIYEGTNGIQSLDLLQRKVLGMEGALLHTLLSEIDAFCDEASEQPELDAQASVLRHISTEWAVVSDGLAQKVQGDPELLGSAATDYLMLSGYIVLGWLWLKAALVAHRQLETSTAEVKFYRTKIQTAQFYFDRILPRTATLFLTLSTGSALLMDIDDDAFIF